MITQNYLDRSMSYGQYYQLVQDLAANGKTTGGNQSEAYIGYTKLNAQRMHRLDKTTLLTGALCDALKQVNNSYIWLVLTESWCGDAAQNLPVMALVEKARPLIELRLLLRDENLDLMDQYLTGSSRSIPKLICAEKDGLKELFTWGPRPEALQALALELLAQGVSKEDKSLAVQKWYTADKTLSLQQELLQLTEQFLK
jgi:hypothetical protein